MAASDHGTKLVRSKPRLLEEGFRKKDLRKICAALGVPLPEGTITPTYVLSSLVTLPSDQKTSATISEALPRIAETIRQSTD